MCLIKVKEEDETPVPARRVRRRTLPDAAQTSRIAYVLPQAPPLERTFVIHQPPPPPPPPSPPPPPPPSSLPMMTNPSPSPPPSLPIMTNTSLPPPPPSLPIMTNASVDIKPPTPPPPPSMSERSVPASGVRSLTHYVEVTPDSASSDDESIKDIRSRTTLRSRHPDSESEYQYRLREREYRRQRELSDPRDDYEHYRYVRAPPDGGRYDHRKSPSASGRLLDNTSSSRDGNRAERERIIEVNNGRTTTRYRR